MRHSQERAPRSREGVLVKLGGAAVQRMGSPGVEGLEVRCCGDAWARGQEAPWCVDFSGDARAGLGGAGRGLLLPPPVP